MKSMLRSSALAAPIFVLGSLIAFPSSVLAEVKSLTSSELTETFIRDSTIIVTPKQQQATRQETVTSLTVSPSDVTQSELEEIKNAETHMDNADYAATLSDEELRNYKWKRGFKNRINVDDLNDDLTIPDYDTINAPPSVADILEDPRFAVPEGDQWARMYAGSQLGIRRDGDTFTFSIGAPEGVGDIKIPEAVHGDGISIVPRDGGGLDVTLQIPKPE